VRKAAGAAIGARNQIAGYQGILRTAAVTAALRVFALWMWGHVDLLMKVLDSLVQYKNMPGKRPALFPESGLNYISRRQERQV
jgi:hypothetical protein